MILSINFSLITVFESDLIPLSASNLQVYKYSTDVFPEIQIRVALCLLGCILATELQNLLICICPLLAIILL